MADFLVSFVNVEDSSVVANVNVSFAIDVNDAAAEYETIVELAYGVLREEADKLGLTALGLYHDDFDATKIMHGDEMIIDFTAE